jgi:hypothetical protein
VILPACFAGIELELGWAPTALGELLLARAVATSVASPIFGVMASKQSAPFADQFLVLTFKSKSGDNSTRVQALVPALWSHP